MTPEVLCTKGMLEYLKNLRAVESERTSFSGNSHEIGSKIALDESNKAVKPRGSLLVETISLLPRCVIVTDMLREWLNLSCGETKRKLLKIFPPRMMADQLLYPGGNQKIGRLRYFLAKHSPVQYLDH